MSGLQPVFSDEKKKVKMINKSAFISFTFISTKIGIFLKDLGPFCHK